MSKLAVANGTTVAELMKANPNITNPNLIYAGKTLNIPTTGVGLDKTLPAGDIKQASVSPRAGVDRVAVDQIVENFQLDRGNISDADIRAERHRRQRRLPGRPKRLGRHRQPRSSEGGSEVGRALNAHEE